MATTLFTFGCGTHGELGISGSDGGTWHDTAVVAFPVRGSATVETVRLGTDHSMALVGGRAFRWGLFGAHAVPRSSRSSSIRNETGPVTLSPEVVPTPRPLTQTQNQHPPHHRNQPVSASRTGRQEGSLKYSLSPERGNTERTYCSLACGGSNSFLLSSDGEAWLLGNLWPLGGDPSQLRHLWGVPQGGPPSRVAQIAGGWRHCLILTEVGCVFALGDDEHGQCAGINTGTAALNTPTGQAIVGVSAGACHSVAWDVDGAVFTWGHNGSGRLGLGPTDHIRKPTRVERLATEYICAATCGASFTLFATAPASARDEISRRRSMPTAIWACGGNRYGQLGLGGGFAEVYDQPVRVPVFCAGEDIIDLAAGANHALCISRPGGSNRNDFPPTAWSWGCASSGQCGRAQGEVRGSQPPQFRGKPVSLADFTAPSPNWGVAVAAGRTHSAVLARIVDRAPGSPRNPFNTPRVKRTAADSPANRKGNESNPVATQRRRSPAAIKSNSHRSVVSRPATLSQPLNLADDIIGDFLNGLSGSSVAGTADYLRMPSGAGTVKEALLVELGEEALRGEGKMKETSGQHEPESLPLPAAAPSVVRRQGMPFSAKRSLSASAKQRPGRKHLSPTRVPHSALQTGLFSSNQNRDRSRPSQIRQAHADSWQVHGAFSSAELWPLSPSSRDSTSNPMVPPRTVPTVSAVPDPLGVARATPQAPRDGWKWGGLHASLDGLSSLIANIGSLPGREPDFDETTMSRRDRCVVHQGSPSQILVAGLSSPSSRCKFPVDALTHSRSCSPSSRGKSPSGALTHSKSSISPPPIQAPTRLRSCSSPPALPRPRPTYLAVSSPSNSKPFALGDTDTDEEPLFGLEAKSSLPPPVARQSKPTQFPNHPQVAKIDDQTATGTDHEPPVPTVPSRQAISKPSHNLETREALAVPAMPVVSKSSYNLETCEVDCERASRFSCDRVSNEFRAASESGHESPALPAPVLLTVERPALSFNEPGITVQLADSSDSRISESSSDGHIERDWV